MGRLRDIIDGMIASAQFRASGVRKWLASQARWDRFSGADELGGHGHVVDVACADQRRLEPCHTRRSSRGTWLSGRRAVRLNVGGGDDRRAMDAPIACQC